MFYFLQIIVNIYALHRKLDHQSLEPALKGMVRQSEDQKTFIIGIAGLYRITATLNWTTSGCGSDNIQIRVENKMVAARCNGNYGPGTVSVVCKLKKGDKVTFISNCITSHATSLPYNSFQFEKL